MLNMAVANKMVLAAMAECDKRGYKVSASVVDRYGNLQAFLRNPLSGPHTILTSQRKAYTAASLQVSTVEGDNIRNLQFAPGLLLIQGGLPISVGGEFYGGVGVSGATPQDDEKCAKAAITAVTEILEFGSM